MSMPPSRAQKSRTRPLIAWLGGSSPTMAARDLNGFLQGLKDFNHVDGTDIDIVYRWANGDLSQQPKLVRELLALGPDLVVTANTDAAVEARRASATIPIVCPDLMDPIGSGMAVSYNHPTYNVTGVLLTLDGLVGKQLEILADLLPQARTVAILVNRTSLFRSTVIRDAESGARGKSLKLVPIEASSPEDLEAALGTTRREGVDALIVTQDAMLFTYADRIIAFVAAARLPTLYGFRQHVEKGGLMSYTVDLIQNFRRAAYFVDRILKGASPTDLPIEFPTKLELVINLKAANAIGLTIPEPFQLRADEVIE
jgi:ABC-type uncharacterized transport system substrate-binding protein